MSSSAKQTSSGRLVTPQKRKHGEDKGLDKFTREVPNVGASRKIQYEISFLQSAIPADDVDDHNDKLMIPKAAFLRLVRQVSQGVCEAMGITRPVFWSGEALKILHVSAEAHLVDGFLTADVLRAHRAQSTLMPDDMKLAPFITSHGTTAPPAFVKERKRLQRYVEKRNTRLKNAAEVVYKKPFH